MKIRIRAFGKLSEEIPDPLELEEVVDTRQLEALLHKRYPGLAKTRYLMAVDRRTITTNTTFKEGSEIALLPAFSGG